MRPIGINFIGRAIALAMSSPFGVGGGKFHYKENEMFTDTVYLGAYKREVFDKIGMYDEELHYSEDDELNYRLLKSGGKIFLTPKIRSYYYCRSSIPSFWRQYYNYGYGKVRTLRKHRGLASWRHFVPPAFVLSLICGLAAWVIEPSFRWLFWLILGTYIASSVFASVRIGIKKGLKYSPILPIVFITMHVSYGVGFLKGILDIIVLKGIGNLLRKTGKC